MGTRLLLVSPSIVLIAVFVYGLIGWNVKVSLSDWRQAEQTSGWAGLAAYRDLNADPAWDESVHHLLVFTGTFVVGALFFGLLLAFLLEKGVRGEGFFRSVYIFPLAVSFIAGRRLALAHEPGSRRPRQRAQRRVRQARHRLSRQRLVPARTGDGRHRHARDLGALRLHHGPLPCGLPRRSRGAARGSEDGRRQGMARVPARRLPHSAPRDAHGADHPRPSRLAVFDLIVAIGGKQLITQTPAVYMWILIYDAFDYAEGAAIATLLLIGISILVIPYLIYSVRTEQRA